MKSTEEKMLFTKFVTASLMEILSLEIEDPSFVLILEGMAIPSVAESNNIGVITNMSKGKLLAIVKMLTETVESREVEQFTIEEETKH